MQQVYGDDCLGGANVFLWHKRFLGGRERLEDDNREGRPISAMPITFFDSKGIIHRELVPTGQTITQEKIYNRHSIAPALRADFQRCHDAGRIPKGYTGLVVTTNAEHQCCASAGLQC